MLTSCSSGILFSSLQHHTEQPCQSPHVAASYAFCKSMHFHIVPCIKGKQSCYSQEVPGDPPLDHHQGSGWLAGWLAVPQQCSPSQHPSQPPGLTLLSWLAGSDSPVPQQCSSSQHPSPSRHSFFSYWLAGRVAGCSSPVLSGWFASPS